jgi:aminoglycoside phosphotransferase (APT) family kinase protein
MAAASGAIGGSMTADPQLPQLATVLDEQRMLGILGDGCLADPKRYEARSCEIEHVRYKPSANCLIRYDLVLNDRRHNHELRQILCGRAYPRGESVSRWLKAQDGLTQSGPGVRPISHFPALDLIVWGFPNERKLRDVSVLLDAIRLRDEILPGIVGAGAIRSITTELIRYVPEHGCTACVRALTLKGAVVLYGKIQSAGDGARTCALARALGREAWYQPAYKISWQGELEGRPATVADCPEIARAVARLQLRHLEGLKESPRLARTDQALRLLNAHPEAIEILADADQRISHPGTAATLHGDAHLKNFIVNGGEAEAIDLDTLCAGDPLEDVGSFAASLYHRAALDGVNLALVDRAVAQFTAEYVRNVPWPADARSVAAHTARALIVERACRCITRRKGDVLETLIATAARLLADTQTARDVMRHFAARAAARPGRLVDVHYKTFRKRTSWGKSYATVAAERDGVIEVERYGSQEGWWRFPHDPAMPWAATVLDPQAVLAELPVRADRVEIEVLNYRPEDRVTARYRLYSNGTPFTIYGKTYADDRGATIYQRMLALNRAGYFGPPPLGYSARVRTMWQAAFAGRPVRDCITGCNVTELLTEAAVQLHALHASGIACPTRMPLQEQWSELHKKLAKLATVAPEYRPRFDALTGRLRDLLPSLTPVPAKVVHGDFHLRQLMVQDSRVALFDLDEIGYGDATEDFGCFVADLHSDGFDRAFVGAARKALLTAYAEVDGSGVPADRLRWHTAVQILTRAYRALLQLNPDFDSRLKKYVALTEEQLL